jgi:hypothetical protein
VVLATVAMTVACSGPLDEVLELPSGVASVAIGAGSLLVGGAWQSPDLDVFEVAPDGFTPGVDLSGVFGPAEPGSGATALAVGDEIAIASSRGELLAFSLMDPGEPRIASRVESGATSGSWQSLDIEGSLGVFSFSRGTPRNGSVQSGLSLLDLSDPSDMKRLAEIELPDGSDNIGDLDLDGGLLLVAARRSGLYVFDVTDPTAPVLRSHLEPGLWARGVASKGDVVYLAVSMAKGSSELFVIDLADPSRPEVVTRVETAGVAQRITVSGNRLYVADREAGLRVYDVQVPTEPLLVGRVRTRGHAVEVVASDGLVAVWGNRSRTATIYRELDDAR